MQDFNRIEQAILYLRDHYRSQPELEEVAREVHLSPFHFQRLFQQWAGVTPKKFLQYISLEHAKSLLRDNLTLAQTSFETGLSGTGRLHDLFIGVEGMTPGEYRQGGKALQLAYRFAPTPFGEALVVSTGKGICHLAFADNRQEALREVQEQFPRATLLPQQDPLQADALSVFSQDWSDIRRIRLHLRGSSFQLKVWQALLRVPFGTLVSYRALAAAAGAPGASRAAGNAVAANPVAFLIPCHRVIRSTGLFGSYHWGEARKAAMIGWESARLASHR
ncbi:MAG TPA: methylated-DNA--[protein]-cysteine S-methyltransferase [Chitinophagaceae bacterium]|nr:methylated-DNA--[protein]-cysteine S-methyltransferase [Chitinophagaceae bacterium]